MQGQGQQHAAHIGAQALQQVDALLGEYPAHQEEHTIGRQLHDQLHQLHHHYVEIFKDSADALAVVTGMVECNTHQDGKHDHLQHVAFGHGLHGVIGEDIDQHLHERRALLGHIGVVVSGQVGTRPWVEHTGHRQRQTDGDTGGNQIKHKGLAAQPPQAFALLRGDHPTDQRHQHQGHDHQLEQVNEDFAEHQEHTVDQVFLHPGRQIGTGAGPVMHQQANAKAQNKAEENTKRQRVFWMLLSRLRRICHPGSLLLTPVINKFRHKPATKQVKFYRRI